MCCHPYCSIVYFQQRSEWHSVNSCPWMKIQIPWAVRKDNMIAFKLMQKRLISFCTESSTPCDSQVPYFHCFREQFPARIQAVRKKGNRYQHFQFNQKTTSRGQCQTCGHTHDYPVKYLLLENSTLMFFLVQFGIRAQETGVSHDSHWYAC